MTDIQKMKLKKEINDSTNETILIVKIDSNDGVCLISEDITTKDLILIFAALHKQIAINLDESKSQCQ